MQRSAVNIFGQFALFCISTRPSSVFIIPLKMTLYRFLIWSSFNFSSTRLVQCEYQAEILHICGFILLGIHEVYPAVSEINGWIVFIKHADVASCFSSRARYPIFDMLCPIQLEVQDEELELADRTNSCYCLVELLWCRLARALQMKEPIMKTLIIKPELRFRLLTLCFRRHSRRAANCFLTFCPVYSNFCCSNQK